MEPDKLVRMANQVASYFVSYPDEDATRGVLDHIVSFWTPGMVTSLAARVAAGQDGVNPLVVRAMNGLARQRAGVTELSGTSPIRKEVAGPAELGELASDAG